VTCFKTPLPPSFPHFSLLCSIPDAPFSDLAHFFFKVTLFFSLIFLFNLHSFCIKTLPHHFSLIPIRLKCQKIFLPCIFSVWHSRCLIKFLKEFQQWLALLNSADRSSSGEDILSSSILVAALRARPRDKIRHCWSL
jgi:hypothetical protein